MQFIKIHICIYYLPLMHWNVILMLYSYIEVFIAMHAQAMGHIEVFSAMSRTSYT